VFDPTCLRASEQGGQQQAGQGDCREQTPYQRLRRPGVLDRQHARHQRQHHGVGPEQACAETQIAKAALEAGVQRTDHASAQHPQSAALAGAEACIRLLGCPYLLAAGLAPHRHVALQLALFPDRGHMRLDPVVVAVLAAVLDDADPGTIGLQRVPEVGVGFDRHVGVANDVVRLALQFLPAEATDIDELLIGPGDPALRVGGGDDPAGVGELDLATGHGLVVAHDGLAALMGARTFAGLANLACNSHALHERRWASGPTDQP
jgi:hypothetical protein